MSPSDIDTGDKIQRVDAQSPLSRARATIARLYVDTEHDALELISIAEGLAESKFDAATLDRMFRADVTPVCRSYAPIGVWPDFDVEWLNEQIETRNARLAKGGVFAWLNRFAQRKPDRETEAQWQKILRYLGAPNLLRDEAQRLRAEASR